MSTSPGTRRWWAARAVIVGATVFASIASSTVVVGRDPAGDTVAAAPVTTVTATTVPTTTAPPAVTATTVPTTTAPPAEPDPCGVFPADLCFEVEVAAPSPVETVPSCLTGDAHNTTGVTSISPAVETTLDDTVAIRIEVEDGIAAEPQCFADEVMDILNDERGWSSVEAISFAQVAGESYDLRIILATPDTADSLCYPAQTAGIYSCRRGDRVVINLMRWAEGTDEYADDLTTYRQYLINHEVGHFLGRGHVQCPAPGEPAPVMMQQTKTLGECKPNGWPTESER